MYCFRSRLFTIFSGSLPAGPPPSSPPPSSPASEDGSEDGSDEESPELPPGVVVPDYVSAGRAFPFSLAVASFCSPVPSHFFQVLFPTQVVRFVSVPWSPTRVRASGGGPVAISVSLRRFLFMGIFLPLLCALSRIVSPILPLTPWPAFGLGAVGLPMRGCSFAWTSALAPCLPVLCFSSPCRVPGLELGLRRIYSYPLLCLLVILLSMYSWFSWGVPPSQGHLHRPEFRSLAGLLSSFG